MLKNLSIKKKIIILFILISIIPLIIVSYINNRQTVKLLDDITENKINRGQNIAKYVLDDNKKDALLIAKRYLNNEELISLFKNKNRDKLDKKLEPIYNSLHKNEGITVFEFGKKNGVVFTRGHHPGKYGDDKSDNESIQRALKGQEVAGFEFGKSGLAVRAFVPIKDNGEVIGTLQVGYNLNQDMLKDIKKLIPGGIAFYQKDKLIQSSNENEQDQIGNEIKDKSIYDRLKMVKKL